MTDPWDQSAGRGELPLAERIALVLAERIIAGALAPGAPVRQDRVADEFRTSHVPVREAFRRLEAQGLLVSRPRRGVQVAPIDRDAVREVTEMRAALETLALRHAGPSLGPDDFAAVTAAIAAADASGDIAVWEAANRRFHRAITAPCGMPRLMAAIDNLHRAGARFLFAAWRDLDWQPRSDSEHRRILAHLAAGDPDRAEEALRQHILAAGRALSERLAAAGGRG